MMRRILYIVIIAPFLLAGCVLTPEGTEEEHAVIAEQGHAYDVVTAERQLPDIPTPATWPDVLHRAFLANGDLEAVYFEWKAALAKIPQVASYPNTNLAPSFSYMFSGGNMKAWDRTTVEVGFDSMESLAFPTKVAKAGERALHEAQAAGARFEEAKFALQRKVLVAYFDLALADEKLRVQQENITLLRLLSDTAMQRLKAGASEQDALRARLQLQLAENERSAMQAERDGMRAMLNGMMGRGATDELYLPDVLPEPRPLVEDDGLLLMVGAERNPLLAHHVHELQGRKDALELARMQYIPDINPFAGFTGGISQMAGAMITLPTTIHEIRGMIDESRAMLRASEAELTQLQRDRSAEFVATLYALRSAERQAAFVREHILPASERLLATTRQTYAAGTGTFADLIEGQRTLLDVRLMLAEQTTAREKRLAELEELAGIDIETLEQYGLRHE